MTIYSQQDDHELFLLLRQESAAAFEEIYNRYWDRLFNSAFKRLHDTQVSEEIVQEIFEKLWLNRNKLNLASGLSNYLFTAVKYSVIDHYRKQINREKYLSNSLTELSENTIEGNLFLNDLIRQINELVGQLPPKCRSVYELSRVEHKTNKEIAVLLNISEKTVEGHLTKALSLLKVNLGNFISVALLLLFK